MSQEFILKRTKKTHLPAKITEKFSKRVVRIERVFFFLIVHVIVSILYQKKNTVNKR